MIALGYTSTADAVRQEIGEIGKTRCSRVCGLKRRGQPKSFDSNGVPCVGPLCLAAFRSGMTKTWLFTWGFGVPLVPSNYCYYFLRSAVHNPVLLDHVRALTLHRDSTPVT